MIKFLLYFLTFSFLFISCNSSRDDDYFDTLNKKISKSLASPNEDRDVIVKRFYNEELQKYNQNKK